MFRIIIILSCFLFSSNVVGQVFINEFMASNSSTVQDPDYDESADWIELYNNGAVPVNLEGYFLTDNLENPDKWQIKNVVIPAKGFVVFWADSKDSANHTNFNLSASGEVIGLYRNNLTVVDSISFREQDTGISSGRKTDGNLEWSLFPQATPGQSNGTGVYSGIVKSDPSFSIRGGVYEQPLTLSVKSIFGGIVRYTLDGSEPNGQSPVAGSPITIDKNTVVRARIFKEGEIPGPVVTNTYLIDTKQEIGKLPIVCISSEPDNFWDPEKGIYVPHDSKPDWEILVNIELYENDGRPDAGFNLKAGVKSTGLYSWQLPEKMLGVSFRKEYGAGKLEYPLILDKVRKVYDTFSIRASGSDWGSTMFRDGLAQTAALLNTSLDNSGFRPCVVFINGQYMGIHNLREKIDEDYIVGNHALEPGTFDMIEETDAGAYAETGNFEANDRLLLLAGKDLTDQANYDAVAAEMDIANFIELVSTEVYTGNSSIGHNLMKWKPKDGGKWKWIMMDFDRGFSGVSNELISFYINEEGWPLEPLMKNDGFKKQFGLKLSDLLFTTFNPDRMVARIEAHKQAIESEMPRHIERWKGTSGFGNYSNVKAISSMDYWNSEVEKLKTFAKARPDVILNDLTNYGFNSPVSVSIQTLPAGAGNLTFNGLKVPRAVCNGAYPQDEQIRLTADAKPGFRFKGWKSLGDTILIEKDGFWKYADNGNYPGESWTGSGFDDSSWNQGQAELGYGDRDEKTIVEYGGDNENRYPTTYFRKQFFIRDKTRLKALSLALKCDDGAVVYLNGVELTRYNMPSGAIGYETLASSALSGTNEISFHNFVLDLENLTNGTNIIAVEVHQVTGNSSDLSFNLELAATLSDNAGFISTGKELVVQTQTKLTIAAVFESDGKCILPAEINTPMTLSKECSPYLVPDNVLITETGSLTIEPGVELWMSDGVFVSSNGSFKALGTGKEPVIIRSNPESALRKWGNISIRNARDTIWLKNLVIENASEGPNPVKDIAALAIENSVVMIDSLNITNVYMNPLNIFASQTVLSRSWLHSDFPGVDLINVKRGKILIDGCDFAGNKGLDSDAIDFGDLEGGTIVRNSFFHDMDGFNSDAVDLGDRSKNVLVDGIVAYNIQDKGVSIGQQSSALIRNSVFINCGMGAGMKDSSSVNIDHCTYFGNRYAIANYQKHPGDAGAHAVVKNSILSNSYESGYLKDEYSALSISNSADDTEPLPTGFANLFVNPQFANPVLNDFSLLPQSPVIGAATDGNMGANIRLPELPVSVLISDIAYFTEAGSEDLEFVGLYNPGSTRVVLDSCMFLAGVSFTFPMGVSIGPGEKFYVTNNAASDFWSGRGAVVFQWESGRLADEGEKIQFANRYGNIIDQVVYNNKAPWPVPQTSDYGITLSRFDVDNHFAEHWKLNSIGAMVSAKLLAGKEMFKVFPNPAGSKINISADRWANETGGIYSAAGKVVTQIKLDGNGEAIVDVSRFVNGVYWIKLGGSTMKFVVIK